jgi:hypothetical protein
MTDLSPAAQEVLDQFVIGACGKTYDIHAGLAAALRAAADQVVPEEPEWPELPFASVNDPWPRWHANQDTRRHLLAIAAELETSTSENR